MRNMSFWLTTRQMRARTKSVTRRLGWLFLERGDLVMAVVKCRGLKKGEKVERIGPIRIVSVRRERLDDVTQVDCIREGFPEMTPTDFVEMFCEHYGCPQWEPVTRIEFEFVEIEI